MRLLIALLLCLTPSLAWAEDVAVIVDSEKPGTFLLTVAADGSVSVSPLRVVRVGTPNPKPPPVDPVETALQVRVKVLTREAIAAGGRPETAAKLAGVYAVVSGFCLDGTLSPDMVRGTAAKPGFLSAATDKALEGAADKAHWTAWRQGIGTELALRHPAGAETTKELLGATLHEVSSAIKNHLGGQVAAGILDNFKWSEILDLLRPVIKDLLLKFLAEWIKGL